MITVLVLLGQVLELRARERTGGALRALLDLFDPYHADPDMNTVRKLLRFGYPMAPLVLGLVLGPIVETNFRNALAVSEMNPGVFFSRPISASLIITTVLVLLWSWRRQVQASSG